MIYFCRVDDNFGFAMMVCEACRFESLETSKCLIKYHFYPGCIRL